jgi:hypothetical protein
VYDEGLSAESNVAVGCPYSAYQAPENFVLELIGGSGYATLSWTIPGGAGHAGFNLYRDGEVLTQLGPGVFSYNDMDVEFYQEYCWQVSAYYSDGNESNLTDAMCGHVDNPDDYSVLSHSDCVATAGEQVTCTIDVENQFGVAGFQFTLTDTPNLLTPVTLVPTDRISTTDGWQMQWNPQPDGSIIVVAFNIMGGVMEVGSGPIIEITYDVAGGILEETPVGLLQRRLPG